MGYYSVNFDWSEEFKNNFDKWENLGRQTAEESCTHKTQDEGEDKETNMRYSGYCEECGHSEDSCNPMMNYAYPLMCEPNEDAIKKVINETCLTIMYNNETDEHFLVLCGGGMDLSQSIGLAYLFTDGRIHKELINEISKQKGLSVGGKNWKFLRNSIIEQLKQQKENTLRVIKEWKETKE